MKIARAVAAGLLLAGSLSITVVTAVCQEPQPSIQPAQPWREPTTSAKRPVPSFLAAPAPRAPAPPLPPLPSTSITGPVTEVPNATTLVVADHRIRLIGIDPGPPDVLAPFEHWLLHKAGILQCAPVAQTGRYLCHSADGSDVGGTAVLSGVARVGEGATADYRKLENQAREARRGFWIAAPVSAVGRRAIARGMRKSPPNAGSRRIRPTQPWPRISAPASQSTHLWPRISAPAIQSTKPWPEPTGGSTK
jgi:endonuclease YncB( thermonuclease family)